MGLCLVELLISFHLVYLELIEVCGPFFKISHILNFFKYILIIYLTTVRFRLTLNRRYLRIRLIGLFQPPGALKRCSRIAVVESFGGRWYLDTLLKWAYNILIT